MDFDLKEEHKMIRDMARDFAREVIRPRSEEIEKTGNYPYDIMKKMAQLGMMGIPFPEEYGGSGGDWVGMHMCIEEISWGDMTLGALLDVTTSIVAQELYAFGTEEQKRKWLVPIAKGEQIGAFGLTEPNAGSDAASIQTRAALKGNEWVLNGTKQFITNIGLDNASIILAAAVTEKRPKGKNIISAFIVPKTAPGFYLGKRYDKIAWNGSATHEVIFENCRIPKDNLLGDPAKGFAQHLEVLQTGRISIAAIAVGMAQACLEESVRYAKERVQFGRPIFDFQAVQFKLADMAVAIELAR
ncbi:MAG TPA: acyl-CoA dehydrogenase, partial [Desulfobacterales bacterium]|nr:acyl-CoA dehydrogenase [Desulfobacterales bacterium]